VFDLPAYLGSRRAMIEAALDRLMPAETTPPPVLHRAMRYSLFAGGKRLRPILCLAACEAAGAAAERALLPACALEVLHTYTLVHDDLPCMDNDALRRGKPTAHVVFGEATALLAGDALLTLAFEWLAAAPAPPPHPAGQLALELARAAGSQGVIAGQVEDLAAEGQPPDAGRVDAIHRLKTAALIRGAVRIGAICGGAPPAELNALTRYGEDIGLAFQIADDILNATSSPGALGKPAGSDRARGKLTYVAAHGLDAARTRAKALVDSGRAALADLRQPSAPLEALALHIIERPA
jgi:geranylgeranyl diphosphate synthase type II